WGGGNQGPTLYCRDPSRYSDSVTTFEVPEGHDAERLRKVLLERYNVSTGGGLGALSNRVFRIGHMGDLNEAMILGTLATVEIALGEVGMPHTKGGVMAAMESLAK
ncbi:MAG TPA: serine--glyoxylate aminotransferase, partial [Acidocella sp.]|nr:serine--glyoxylate aminotransferase [Acidocella sp.]